MGDLKIIKGGLFTTVQDAGRIGYQKYGVPVSGVMDFYSYRLANMLVDNSENEAVFEVTLPGFSVEFLKEIVIAVTGGNLAPELNGSPIAMWETRRVMPGDKLEFTKIKSGCRSYLAFAGGIDVPKVMNSRSTYIRGKIGGYHGRILKVGDLVNLKSAENSSKEKEITDLQGRSLVSEAMEYPSEINVRLVPGPQEEAFTEDGIRVFYQGVYKVTNESDRMGFRLEGSKVEHRNKSEIISDGIAMGAVQIPGHGKPIVLMADRQTAGGYPKIGNIITADLPKFAQLKPGDRIRFQKVTIEEAQDAYRIMFQRLKSMNAKVKEFHAKENELKTDQRKFNVRVNNKKYTVIIEKREENFKN